MPYTYDYPRPAVTVDSLIFSIDPDKGLEILLIERANNPFKGSWAIPGGFVDMDEDLIPAAKRELQEETGMLIGNLYEVGVFAKPDRDPRGRVITIAFWELTDKNNYTLKAADDAKRYAWKAVNNLPDLAFDHLEIIQTALQKFKAELLKDTFIANHFSQNTEERNLNTLCQQLFEEEDASMAFKIIKANIKLKDLDSDSTNSNPFLN